MFLNKIFGKKAATTTITATDATIITTTSSFCNIVLFGNAESYKSALFRAFCGVETPANRNNSAQFGIDFREKEFKVSNRVATTLNIWCINREISSKDFVSQYCRGAHGVLLCYNPENKGSINFIKFIAEGNASLLSELNLSTQIVCISTEKKESEKPGAPQKEVKSIAKKVGANVLNCSLDDSGSIDDVFRSLVTDITKKCKIEFSAGSDSSAMFPPKPLTQPPKPTQPLQGDKGKGEESPVSLISLCRYKGVEDCAKRDVKRSDDGLFGEYKCDSGQKSLCYRVSVLGNPRIGKSCLCARYLEGKYSWKDESDRLWTRSFCLPKRIFLKLRMCEGPLPNGDTDPRLEDHFSRSHAVLLCYDITDRASFDAVAAAAAGVRADAMGGAAVMVVGLRYDDKRHVEVPGEEGRALADANGMMFRECSAADNVGVQEVFTKILSELQQVDSFALPISVDGARHALKPSVVPNGLQEDEEDPRLATLLDGIITENGLNKEGRAREDKTKEGKEYDHLFKILLKGNSGTGKSSLLLRYVYDTFSDLYVSSIGVDFKTKAIETPSDSIVKLQIWDIACSERFRSPSPSYYRGAHAIILCFDTTDKEYFDDLNRFVNDIERYAPENVTVVIVGTKSDLPPVVDPAAAREFAEPLGYPLMYCSSKTGDGVDEVFSKAVACIGYKRGLDLGFDF